jgi:enamine deaminase RidA (YjgF/YER057c/UK114 family)
MNIKRSTFIKLGALAAISPIAIPTLFHSCKTATRSTGATCCEIDAEQRIKELGLVLPPVTKPLGIYKPILVSGNMLYVSGQAPVLPDGSLMTGKVGADLSLEEGRLAARQAGLTMISVIKEYFGDLNRICRLIKTLGMVNCTVDFHQQPAVINGFSGLMAEIFGDENGIGVRSAVGMMLPSNIAVEVEAIFELKS